MTTALERNNHNSRTDNHSDHNNDDNDQEAHTFVPSLLPHVPKQYRRMIEQYVPDIAPTLCLLQCMPATPQLVRGINKQLAVRDIQYFFDHVIPTLLSPIACNHIWQQVTMCQHLLSKHVLVERRKEAQSGLRVYKRCGINTFATKAITAQHWWTDEAWASQKTYTQSGRQPDRLTTRQANGCTHR